MGRLRTATRWVVVGAGAAIGAAGLATARRRLRETKAVHGASEPDQTTCLVTIDRPPAEVMERFRTDWPATDISEGPGIQEHTTRRGPRTVRTHQLAWRQTENGESYAGTARFASTALSGATELRLDVRAEKASPHEPATTGGLEARIRAQLRAFKRLVEAG
jgi:hypothetical protein